ALPCSGRAACRSRVPALPPAPAAAFHIQDTCRACRHKLRPRSWPYRNGDSENGSCRQQASVTSQEDLNNPWKPYSPMFLAGLYVGSHHYHNGERGVNTPALFVLPIDSLLHALVDVDEVLRTGRALELRRPLLALGVEADFQRFSTDLVDAEHDCPL